MDELKIAILAGSETKQFLADFIKQINRLEKIMGGKTLKASDAVEEEETEEVEEDEDFEAKPKKGGAKGITTAFEEEDEDEETEELEAEVDEDDDEGFTAAPAKPAKKKAAPKAKKLTVDDVNDACKLRASSVGGKKGRAEVLAILKKKFKTESVSELKPEQYETCIEAMKVTQ